MQTLESIYDPVGSPTWSPKEAQWRPEAITEPEKEIPISLGDHEIHHTPVNYSPLEESPFKQRWVKHGETESGTFEWWTKYQTRSDSHRIVMGNVRALPISARSTMRDMQTWRDTLRGREFRGEKTFGTIPAPLNGTDPDTMYTDVAPLKQRAEDAMLFWVGDDAKQHIDEQTVRKAAETLGLCDIELEPLGNACAVYYTEKEDPVDREAALDARSAAIQTDIVTGEQIRTLQWTDVDNATGQKIADILREARSATKDGGTADISEAIRLCHYRGPIKEWFNYIPEEDLNRLQDADHELIDRLFRDLWRCLDSERIRRILWHVDMGMEVHIHPYVEKIANEDAKQEVERALQLWEDNKENPRRNFSHARSSIAAGFEDKEKPSPYPTALYRENPSFFTVGEQKPGNPKELMTSGYDPSNGTLFIRSLPDSKYDFPIMLGIVMELVRVNQHLDAIGATDNYEANHEHYVSWAKHRFLEDDEKFTATAPHCAAWSTAVELFFARLGNGSHTQETAMEELGISKVATLDETRRRKVRGMFQLGKHYAGGGARRGDTYPAKFIEAIEEAHKISGSNIMFL